MQDLSGLCKWPYGGESMAAGNGCSDESHAMTAPGSRSEQTAGETPGVPGPDVPAQDDERTAVERVHDAGPSPDSFFPNSPRIVRGAWNDLSGGAR